jgi:hypothetical protein
MRFLFAVLLAFFVSPVSATTYDYVGQSFTSFSGLCNASSCTNITGSVTFDFDTSNFSGTLTLSAGDTASLSEGVPSESAFFNSPGFPSSTEWFNPPIDTYGYNSQLNGNLTLINGAVTSWYLYGSTGQVGCGGGPGCASGTSYGTSSPTGDSSSSFGYLVSAAASNSDAGIWTEVPAVPELSTWAMLLIGFAGIGAVTFRRQALARMLT